MSRPLEIEQFVAAGLRTGAHATSAVKLLRSSEAIMNMMKMVRPAVDPGQNGIVATNHGGETAGRC